MGRLHDGISEGPNRSIFAAREPVCPEALGLRARAAPPQRARSAAGRDPRRPPGAAGGRAGGRRRRAWGRGASSRRRRRPRRRGRSARCRSRSRWAARRAASAASKPHGAMTSSSGSAADTSSQVVGCDGRPGSARRASPPAASIICGSQWPGTNGGSIHSATKTRGRRAPARSAASVERRTSSIAAAHLAGDLPPPLRHAEPRRERLDRCRDLVERGRVERDHGGADRAGRPELARADGAHRAQVLGDDHVRCQLVDERRVDRVQRPPVRDRRPHLSVDLDALELRAGRSAPRSRPGGARPPAGTCIRSSGRRGSRRGRGGR